MSAYEALADLAERELDLVATGAFEELAALGAERSALTAALPATPPPAALPALERAAKLQARVSEALQERLGSTAGDLRRISRGRTAMRGYAPAGERLKLVDQAG